MDDHFDRMRLLIQVLCVTFLLIGVELPILTDYTLVKNCSCSELSNLKLKENV